MTCSASVVAYKIKPQFERCFESISLQTQNVFVMSFGRAYSFYSHGSYDETGCFVVCIYGNNG